MATSTKQAAADKVKYLTEFTPLAVNSKLLKPSASPTNSARPGTSPPPLVVLCTWMGAHPKHISKYTDAYREHFPDAGILLITCEPVDMLTRSFAQQQATLSPVRDVLQSIRDERQTTTTPLILHVFSHGGCNSAIQLAKSFKKHTGSSTPMPFRAFILDCCPGRPSLGRSVRAMGPSLPPNPLVRMALQAFFWVMLGLIYLFVALGLRRGTDLLRKDLCDETLFTPSAKRLYLCSKTDPVVDFEGVSDHADEAAAAGYDVHTDFFPHGPHCGLVRVDETRYWDAVKKVWPSK